VDIEHDSFETLFLAVQSRMSQTLLVDKKAKNAQSAGNWDHDPCKAIQTNKTSEHAACINEAKTTTHLDCACATKSPKRISVEAETC